MLSPFHRTPYVCKIFSYRILLREKAKGDTFKQNIPRAQQQVRTWALLRLVARPPLCQSLGARLRLARTQGPGSLPWRVVAQALSRLDAAIAGLTTAAPRSPFAPAAVHCNNTLTSRVLGEKWIISRLCKAIR